MSAFVEVSDSSQAEVLLGLDWDNDATLFAKVYRYPHTPHNIQHTTFGGGGGWHEVMFWGGRDGVND